MIWNHTEKLRNHIENSKTWPFDKWPEELLFKTNCLAYALGLAVDLGDCFHDLGILINSNPNLVRPKFPDIFETLLTELGLEWRNIPFPDESSPDEYVIQIYGFQDIVCYPYYDFHVIRRNLDGTWIHKPSFRRKPEIINWITFIKNYPNNKISGIYAVKKKTP